MYKWESDPYPYCVIDNFLSDDVFNTEYFIDK